MRPELRDQGITTPILVFGFLDDSNIEEAAQKNITCSALSYSYALHIAELCEQKKLRLSMHIKLIPAFIAWGSTVRRALQRPTKKCGHYMNCHSYRLPAFIHIFQLPEVNVQDETFLARQYQLFW